MFDKEKKKKFISRHLIVLSFIYRMVQRNMFVGKRNNHIHVSSSFLKQCTVQILGKGNILFVEPGLTRLTKCKILILGDNNIIKIGKDCNLHNVTFYVEDDNGKITLEPHVTITGNTSINVIEGRSVDIGEDCLFSYDIDIRVGDSHSVLDKNTRLRINPSADIHIGKHVWVGHNVSILKGVNIGNNCVLAEGSIITKGCYPDNCIVGGVGGRILKEGIDWIPERIKC